MEAEERPTRQPTPKATVLRRRKNRALWKQNAPAGSKVSGIYGKRTGVRARNLPHHQEQDNASG